MNGSGVLEDFHDLVKVTGKELVVLNIVNHTTCQQQDQEKYNADPIFHC
jgi:hypothetical protein